MGNFVSGKIIKLKAKLNPADTSLTADIDVGVTSGRFYFVNDNQEEWLDFSGVAASGSNFVYSNLVRGLSQTADPATAGTGKTWIAGNSAAFVAMHDELVNKQKNNTFSGTQTFTDVAFTGTSTAGLKVKSLTTAERLALTPANGIIVYDTTIGEHYQYIAGAWSAVASGSTQPNASTTVAGKVEIATQAEFNAQTATGGTGAILIPTATEIIGGSAYVGIPGEVRIWTTGTPPTSWLLCDGSAVSRVTYSTLFALIGTTYGVGDGSTTFNVPNMKGKVVAGFNSAETEFDTLGETGGAKTHTLSATEIPAHTHSYSKVPDGAAQSATVASGNYGGGNFASANTDNGTGGGGAHNNLQPYITLNYIIKT